MAGISGSEIVVLGALLAIAAAIAVLCYVWMKNSRASQQRVEEMHRRTIALLEEQNQLLRNQQK